MKSLYLAYSLDEYLYMKRFFKYPSLSYNKENKLSYVIEKDIVIMTSESNPEVMAICYNQGWAANQDYMLKSEAEAVTDIGTAFQNGVYHTNTSMNYNNFIFSFDEFKYFINVKEIKYCAFNAQTKMTSITLPNSIEKIETYAFDGCILLPKITLPKTLNQLEGNVFYRCDSLCEITSLSLIAPTILPYTFSDIKHNGVLKVPQGSDYSNWMSTSNYYLGSYNWTIEYI